VEETKMAVIFKGFKKMDSLNNFGFYTPEIIQKPELPQPVFMEALPVLLAQIL
jgi:hypothetical protein